MDEWVEKRLTFKASFEEKDNAIFMQMLRLRFFLLLLLLVGGIALRALIYIAGEFVNL